MPDDGFSEVGGGGSINWTVDVNDHDDIPKPPAKGGNPRGFNIKGKDRKNEIDVGKYFLIRIDDWRSIELVKVGNDLVMALPIKKKDGQVRVDWSYVRDELVRRYPGLQPMI